MQYTTILLLPALLPLVSAAPTASPSVITANSDSNEVMRVLTREANAIPDKKFTGYTGGEPVAVPSEEDGKELSKFVSHPLPLVLFLFPILLL